MLLKKTVIKAKKPKKTKPIPVAALSKENDELASFVVDLPNESIVRDESTQMRTDRIDAEYVNYLLDEIREKDHWPFPPVECVANIDSPEDIDEGTDIILFNGWHRLIAVGTNKSPKKIPAKIFCLGKKANYSDVLKEATWRGAFADLDTKEPVALGRTTKDKQHAAKVACKMNAERSGKSKLSARALAKKVRLSHTYINEMMKKYGENAAETTDRENTFKEEKPRKYKISSAFVVDIKDGDLPEQATAKNLVKAVQKVIRMVEADNDFCPFDAPTLFELGLNYARDNSILPYEE